jgi:hypothetical protein
MTTGFRVAPTFSEPVNRVNNINQTSHNKPINQQAAVFTLEIEVNYLMATPMARQHFRATSIAVRPARPKAFEQSP